MGVRNSEELGANLYNVTTRLLYNQNLCKLLKYTDDNPLSKPDFKNPVKDVLHKYIKVVPVVNDNANTTESTLIAMYTDGPVNQENSEFDDISLVIKVYVPVREWIVNDISLRPFLIMSEVEKSLKGKTVDGLGKLEYLGFHLSLLTDNLSAYEMYFKINAFD